MCDLGKYCLFGWRLHCHTLFLDGYLALLGTMYLRRDTRHCWSTTQNAHDCLLYRCTTHPPVIIHALSLKLHQMHARTCVRT
jgi:hypothetical protein